MENIEKLENKKSEIDSKNIIKIYNDKKGKKKKVNFWVKIFFGISLLILIISLGINNVNGVSVVSDKAINGKYTINCLGADNIVSLYSKDDTNPNDFKLIYSSTCKDTKYIYASYIDRSVKLNIKNNEDSKDTRIDYTEYFDKIYTNDVNIKMDKFTDEFCFTIKLNHYVDISILSDKQENVKSYYKCFPKSTISSMETSTSGSVVVPVYINNQLKQEFVISKPKEKFQISFQDLGLVSSKLKDKMVITIKNPSGVLTKAQVVDSNIACQTKTFVISDKYKLFCNQSQSINNYFVQIKDSTGNVYYGEYQRPMLNKKTKNVNWYLIGAIILIIGIIGLNVYKNKSQAKDKSAIQQLQERQNEEI